MFLEKEVLDRFIDHFDKRYADFLEKGFSQSDH